MFRAILSELRLYICNHVISCIPIHAVRLMYYRSIMGFGIEENTFILLGAKFDAAQGLVIGANSVVNGDCRIDTRGRISIGSNVSISSEVIILTADHDMNSTDFAGRIKPVEIADRVWVGTRAIILPGVSIGFGAVIAAGAVVTKDVGSLQVVAGIPARQIGTRSDLGFTYQLRYRRALQ
jgi:acetyltransferase-like isoleucine patch superfamily enzyme